MSSDEPFYYTRPHDIASPTVRLRRRLIEWLITLAAIARWVAVAALFVVFAASARADVTLDTILGFGQNAHSGSRYRVNTWSPLTVFIGGQGVRGLGQLQVTINSGGQITTYTHNIPLHAGPLNETAGFAVYIGENNYRNSSGTDIDVQLLVDGRKVASKRVVLPVPIQDESYNILTLSKDGAGLNFLNRKELGLLHRHSNPQSLRDSGQNPGSGDGYSDIADAATTTLLSTLPAALPAYTQAYRAVDAVALADLPIESLTEDQAEALKGYVRQGGLLIVSGGSDIPRLKGALLQDLLPIEGPFQVSLVSQLPALTERYKAPLQLAAPIALVSGKMRKGTQALLGNLVYSRSYGAGTVVFTAFDYLDPSLRTWRGAPAFWRELLRAGNPDLMVRSILNSVAGSSPNTQQLADALAGRPASRVPPLTTVTIFLVAYLVLLIPGSYLVLKRLDRRELAWITAPLVILGFTIASYAIALSIKGGLLTVNRVVTLEGDANSDQLAGVGEMTLYSPRRAAYDITLDSPSNPNSPYRMLVPFDSALGGDRNPGDSLTIAQDNTPTIRGAEVRLWDKRSFGTPVAIEAHGEIDAKVVMVDKASAKVTITNNTRFTLHHCSLISGATHHDLPDMPPGATQTGTIPWAFHDSTDGIAIPFGAAAPVIDAPDVAGTETPEEERSRIRYAFANALGAGASENSYSYNYYGQPAGSYGLTPNVFVGWCDDPLLNVQVDGAPAQGQEVNLLVVHLQTPDKAPAPMQAARNPFAGKPLTELKDPKKGPAGGAPQGVFR